MRRRLPVVSKKLLALLPVLAAAALLLLLVQTRTAPPRRPEADAARAVRVVPAPVADVIPRSTGHGRVRPTLSWTAVAEISGRVVGTHALYEEGAIVPSGTELLRIDPADYELAVQEVTAGIADLEAQLDDLDAQEANNETLLRIEERALELVEEDLRRERELLAAGTASDAVVDEAERRALTQRTAVQRLRNALRLLPAKRRMLKARIDSLGSSLAAARRDLDRTRILAPFDLRITSIVVEDSGYATKGQALLTSDATASVEVPAQFQIDKVRRLLPQGKRLVPARGHAGNDLFARMGLSAVVRLRDGDLIVEWDARLTRIGPGLDPRTRTVAFIVVVEEPYEQARTGLRPPLMREMFVEVELRGPPLLDRVVLPRSALHGDEVYIVDAASRLRRRPVRIELLQDDLVVLADGVNPGDRVIVSDPVPVLEGMLVKPHADDALRQSLVAMARGKERVK